MKELVVLGLVSALVSASLLVAWLDNKHNWQLAAWFSGQVKNPFTPPADSTQTMKQKDRKIAELQARIEVLEKVVTEPAYELNQKLNRL